MGSAPITHCRRGCLGLRADLDTLGSLPLPGMRSRFLFHPVFSLVTVLTELSLLQFELRLLKSGVFFFYSAWGFLCFDCHPHLNILFWYHITRCVHIRQSALLHNHLWTFHQVSCNKVYCVCDVFWLCWPSWGLICELEDWHRRNWNLETILKNDTIKHLNRQVK